MFKNGTDKEWEKFGKIDPYFGVVTKEKFRKFSLTNENKEEFFRSGYVHIDNTLKEVREYIDQTFAPKKALDFGCGVGRLVIPLAEVAENVTGIDVSDSMLSEAIKNCKDRGIKNVRFLKFDDNFSLLDGKYDFIHSHIVFQHISVNRGEQIFKNLISYLENDGICVVDFPYAKYSKSREYAKVIQNYIPLAKNIKNLIKGKSFFAPQMQMNAYNLNKLFLILQRSDIKNCHVSFINKMGALGVVLHFKKSDMI